MHREDVRERFQKKTRQIIHFLWICRVFFWNPSLSKHCRATGIECLQSVVGTGPCEIQDMKYLTRHLTVHFSILKYIFKLLTHKYTYRYLQINRYLQIFTWKSQSSSLHKLPHRSATQTTGWKIRRNNLDNVPGNISFCNLRNAVHIAFILTACIVGLPACAVSKAVLPEGKQVRL